MRPKPLYDSIFPITKDQTNWVGDEADGEEFPVPSALESSKPHSPWVGDQAVR